MIKVMFAFNVYSMISIICFEGYVKIDPGKRERMNRSSHNREDLQSKLQYYILFYKFIPNF